ncbi:MAG: hypothetical protein JGK26_02725 [Microcoleus sp. PH2017_27_LUM_O_A]|nr:MULTISPECIES: hypothetical protein [unclassified Microcoleus]MCC3458647.1 hypothetical protein [Microcoleus sp. PH2017_11_PCY_U_A]MCC3538851.1 hypothetical protein [Microcoleus sp. PH2017_22_RUC_O_B]MCC3558046.1 hypothetical protein [Microcoleus sp. PH2017_27_LUM_O_A]
MSPVSCRYHARQLPKLSAQMAVAVKPASIRQFSRSIALFALTTASPVRSVVAADTDRDLCRSLV